MYNNEIGIFEREFYQKFKNVIILHLRYEIRDQLNAKGNAD